MIIDRLDTTDSRAAGEPETFAFVDALRGWAILAVILGISRRFPSGDAAAIAHYVCIVMTTALLSSITYRAIERPGVRSGRQLIARLEARPFQ